MDTRHRILLLDEPEGWIDQVRADTEVHVIQELIGPLFGPLVLWPTVALYVADAQRRIEERSR